MIRKRWNKRSLSSDNLRTTDTATRMLVLRELIAEYGETFVSEHSAEIAQLLGTRRETIWRARQRLCAVEKRVALLKQRLVKAK